MGPGRVGSAYALSTSAEPLSAAASLLAVAIDRIASLRPTVRVAIPGGSAAAVVGEVRKKLSASSWNSVRLTWVDERCVPFADAESNRGMAHRKGWLDDACLAHELPLYLDGETPEAACVRVAARLRDEFENAIDIALLGLGEDGHIASLFPGKAALGVRDQTVVRVLDSPKPPAQRVSLTLPILETASAKIVFATGEGKRDALRRVLRADDALPLTYLHNIQIITDLDMGEQR